MTTGSTDQPLDGIRRQTGATRNYPAILCAGLPRSGSTWTFNIAALLARSSGFWQQVTMFYSDSSFPADPDPSGSELLVIKSHSPAPLLRTAINWSGSRLIITVRDPRDCVVSLMQTFDFKFVQALQAIAASTAIVADLARAGAPLLLRYEDGFAAQPDCIAAIAHHLGIVIDQAALESLARRFSREQVSRLLEETEFVLLPDQAQPLPKANPETHWHPRHIGDGRTGKYQDLLSTAQIALVDYETRAFRRSFDYADHAPPQPLAPRKIVDFSANGDGAAYLHEGFSFIEDWGVWTQAPRARLDLPLSHGLSNWLRVELVYRCGPSFYGGDARAEIHIDQQCRAAISGALASPNEARLFIWVHDATLAAKTTLRIDLVIDGARSPFELGLSEDRRPIGLGLLRASLDYATLDIQDQLPTMPDAPGHDMSAGPG